MVDAPVLSLRSAGLAFGERQLWRGLTLDVHAGEFLAVLGPNGTGKSSLLKTILGQQSLSSGSISFLGKPVTKGSRQIGYIPQQKLLEPGTPLRARDLVTFGVNGRRWGLPIATAAQRLRVDEVLEAVGATEYAGAPVATLSGGEQQRIRVGQSIAGYPLLLLCDEPLLSLDMHHQRSVSELIDKQRRDSNTAVVFVTHDVNPILGMTDRVLYLAGGRFRIGTPDEVLRSEVLSAMYNTPVEVIRSRGRIVVLGAPEGYGVHDHLEHHIYEQSET
ncbi:MAG: metal ABC transporter ATP-binding protein [Terrimesophilobacter sp.]